QIMALAAPKVAAWKDRIQRQAHAQGYLENPFGHCVGATSRILTGDLRWVEAQSLKAGDVLLAFDEEKKGNYRSRRYRESMVVGARTLPISAMKVHLSDGSVLTTTPNHPWIAEHYPSGGEWVWRETQHLVPGTSVLKAMQPWETLGTRDAGWLAGLFDGEGYISKNPTLGKASFFCGIAQNPGKVFEHIKASLTTLGFQFGFGQNHKDRPCQQLHIKGGRAEQLRFLGSIRPERLLAKVTTGMLGEVQRCQDVKVVKVVPAGKQEITLLETTSRTYFAEGFAMHNSLTFFEVFKKEDGEWRPGKEANEVLAYPAQSTGAAMLRECLVELGEHEDPDYYLLLIPTHDSILMAVWE
ncbi:MAG: hypothetical protein L0Y56_02825, partial [Nitrospira sp.]|nr:hypothetical protein [Nitrospira sp.]